jgi:ribosomal protein S12 methylthiotransferase accessory factor
MLAPADFVFIGRREAGDEAAVAVADSNGCAAGTGAEAAKFAALLELIERDATARWWYGRRARRSVALEDLDAAIPALADFVTEARQRGTRVFDITTDLGVPVFAAMSADHAGHAVALGFAAKPSATEAVLSAVTEMLQMEFSLAMAQAEPDASPHWARWIKEVTTALPPLDAHFPLDADRLLEEHTPITLNSALGACEKAGVGVWFADMTRDEIGIPVFRALSTELCHYKPRFGRARLRAPDPHDLAAAARDAEGQVPLLV